MLQGCSKGLHSNVKPPEPVKEENPADSKKDEVWKKVCFLTIICSLLNYLIELWMSFFVETSHLQTFIFTDLENLIIIQY